MISSCAVQSSCDSGARRVKGREMSVDNAGGRLLVFVVVFDGNDVRLCFEERARMRGAWDAVWRTREGCLRLAPEEAWDCDGGGGWMRVVIVGSWRVNSGNVGIEWGKKC